MSISRNLASVTSEAALAAVRGAVAAGTARGVPVVASVVDPGGHLLACLRADGAFAVSVDISRDKAWTAAIFGVSTDQLCGALSERQVLLDGIGGRDHVVLFGGGMPICENRTVIGGIGVSGGSEDDDRACAAAGLAAIGLGI